MRSLSPPDTAFLAWADVLCQAGLGNSTWGLGHCRALALTTWALLNISSFPACPSQPLCCPHGRSHLQALGAPRVCEYFMSRGHFAVCCALLGECYPQIPRLSHSRWVLLGAGDGSEVPAVPCIHQDCAHPISAPLAEQLCTQEGLSLP